VRMITTQVVVRPNIIHRLISPIGATLVLPIIMLVACTPNTSQLRMSVLPEVSKYPEQVEVLLRGVITYEGKSEYLPRTIAGRDGGGINPSFRYVYEDSHRRDDLMNSFGYGRPFPHPIAEIGSKTQYVVGNLEIRIDGNVIKTYSATAMLTDSTEFSETLTEMRRRGLLAVRNNIEAQMYLDTLFLRSLPR